MPRPAGRGMRRTTDVHLHGMPGPSGPGTAPKQWAGLNRARSLPGSVRPTRDQQRHFQRLLIIQARIDLALVRPRQIRFAGPARPAGAFGDVLAGQFKMHAPKVRAYLRMNLKCLLQLSEDVFELPRLQNRRWL